MVDTVVANQNTTAGAAFATDFDGTENFPVSKLAFGALHVTYTIVDDALNARFPVVTDGRKGNSTDGSGTITVGGTSQSPAGALADRNYVFVMNWPLETELLFLRFGAAATADQASIPLEPGSAWVMTSPNFVETGSVNVLAATTGHKFICRTH